jgi:hypothetical protein
LASVDLWGYDVALARRLATRDGGSRRHGFMVALADDEGR